ncbi:hypothetical protein HEP86_17695 [Streptomyces sp. RPA4-5]|uniref:hypothetical protein n=1 Tax=Streptomyces sp. RPA4-5 TaxID=2721245 RepID=UPI00143E17B6|nr:hypothetical protein [Streptomyces sp. RPA4-5]QIY53167.1 hypothetical protein HEP86_17695 [Streptomyces sp. RPA4-5]
MNADNKAAVPGERDIIRPMDNHQPISGAGVSTQVKKSEDRDVLKPMDNHQPISGAGVGTQVKKCPAHGQQFTPGRF